MKRLLFTILILTGFAFPAAAQETPECDAAGLLITIIETAGATAEDDALDVLTQIGDEISRMKAACSGLTFEGSSNEVIGPVVIPEGIYRARVTTTGYIIVHVIALEGECGGGTRMSENVLAISRDEATAGAEAVFSATGCEALIEISNLSDPPYLLEFELVR